MGQNYDYDAGATMAAFIQTLHAPVSLGILLASLALLSAAFAASFARYAAPIERR